MAVKTSVHPLSKYHPIRWKEARKEFVDKAAEVLIEEFGSGVKAVFYAKQEKIKRALNIFFAGRENHMRTSVSSDMYPTYMRHIYKHIDTYGQLLANQKDFIMIWNWIDALNCDDFMFLRQHTSFNQNGSNIFEFSQELLNLFDETDVDDVLIKDIHLPFSTIYLHFDKQESKTVCGNMTGIQTLLASHDIKWGNGKSVKFYLDGAYVTQCQETGSLSITLASIPDKQCRHHNNCIDCYEEMFNRFLYLISPETTVGSALDSECKNFMSHNKDKFIKEKANNIFPNDLEKNLQKIEDKVDNLNQSFARSLKLVINCLLYLQSYPEQVQDEYPPEAPINLVAQSKSQKTVALVAQNKLKQLGYRKIKFCTYNRQPFEQLSDFEVDEESTLAVSTTVGDNKRTLSPHKRRAHRRKQKYGKGRELWRFVWIKETTIHPEKYQAPSNFYRIYEVASDSKS